jgi:hypothetical protein
MEIEFKTKATKSQPVVMMQKGAEFSELLLSDPAVG